MGYTIGFYPNLTDKDEYVLTKGKVFFEFAHSMGQLRNDILLDRIAAKIKKLREERGVTLEEFYNETNIHLSRLEHSKANVTVSTLKEVCKYFDMTLSDFFKELG